MNVIMIDISPENTVQAAKNQNLALGVTRMSATDSR
jgi:hypothetical protein